MFSVVNNKPEVAFYFSEDLQNAGGIDLATKLCSKWDKNSSGITELEVRRSIFPNSTRDKMEKFSLKLYKTLYGLSRKQMSNYKVEILENWQFLDSKFDLVTMYVRGIEKCEETTEDKEWVSYPSYYPIFKRTII